jgi:hypothetical protein
MVLGMSSKIYIANMPVISELQAFENKSHDIGGDGDGDPRGEIYVH